MLGRSRAFGIPHNGSEKSLVQVYARSPRNDKHNKPNKDHERNQTPNLERCVSTEVVARPLVGGGGRCVGLGPELEPDSYSTKENQPVVF